MLSRASAACFARTAVQFSSLPVRTARRWVSAAAVEASAAARAEIAELWARRPVVSAPITQQATGVSGPAAEISKAARALMDKYHISPETSRDEDVTAALGEAFDRLLLLLVPLDSPEATAHFERLITLAAKNGQELSLRTIQHVFARCQSYPEALAVFHAMRKCGVRMNVQSYYAVCFCLQRLEEESWALRFREDVDKSGDLSPQALQFILEGCSNQLVPENKPWLGRVVFADSDADQATTKGATADYDALGKQWATRYSP
jgi:hypothetical protein